MRLLNDHNDDLLLFFPEPKEFCKGFIMDPVGRTFLAIFRDHLQMVLDHALNGLGLAGVVYIMYVSRPLHQCLALLHAYMLLRIVVMYLMTARFR